MKKIEEIFENNHDCYTLYSNENGVIETEIAMTKEKFLKTIEDILLQIDVLIDGYYYLKEGDTIIDGDEFLFNEDGKWYTIDKLDEISKFTSSSMSITRRKVK